MLRAKSNFNVRCDAGSTHAGRQAGKACTGTLACMSSWQLHACACACHVIACAECMRSCMCRQAIVHQQVDMHVMSALTASRLRASTPSKGSGAGSTAPIAAADEAQRPTAGALLPPPSRPTEQARGPSAAAWQGCLGSMPSGETKPWCRRAACMAGSACAWHACELHCASSWSSALSERWPQRPQQRCCCRAAAGALPAAALLLAASTGSSSSSVRHARRHTGEHVQRKSRCSAATSSKAAGAAGVAAKGRPAGASWHSSQYIQATGRARCQQACACMGRVQWGWERRG